VTTSLTSTGFSNLGDMPWGTHFCLFYETKRDLLETLICYIRAGLNSNEFCLWVLSDGEFTADEAWSALRLAIPDVEEHAAAGRLELISHEEWFLQDGNFEIPKGMSLLKEKYETAMANGLDGMRLNGSTAWLQKRSANDFQIFERKLDDSLAGQRIIVMCNFPLGRIRADELLAATDKHHFALAIRNGVWQIVDTTHAPAREHPLTPRELEVMTWVARGKSAWETGEILGISKRTVDEHTKTAARKLGANNRTQTVALALLRRIIEV
jgi:DNA-binding CsgD family transcriptional regulator